MKNIIDKIKLIFDQFIEQASPMNIALAICLLFLVFYTFQIPTMTTNSDVLIYSSRAGSEKPILNYAFYNESIMHDRGLLPNYHLAHTVILWSAYHILPARFRDSIWPSGFVSALAVSLSLGLSFLFFLQLGFGRREALYISLLVGVIPSFWFHALIGEVYALQFLFIILFAWFFYRDNLVLSTLFFLLSVLVTPISALSISFIFYRGFSKKVFLRGIGVAAASLLIYLGIFFLIGSNILDVARPLGESDESISFIKNKLKFAVILLLNFGLYWLIFFRGARKLFTTKKDFLLRHIAAIAPQLALQISYGGFNEELGSFHLVLFWGMTPLFIAGMRDFRFQLFKIAAPLFLAIFFVTLWYQPNLKGALDRQAAGLWIKNNYADNIKLLGDWESNVALVQTRLGWGLDIFEHNMYEHRKICDDELIQSGQDSLIIAVAKRPYWRQLLSRVPHEYFVIKREFFKKNITIGQIQRIYENDAVTLYYWNKPQENP